MGCTSAQVVVSFYDQARDSRLQMRLTVNCSDLIADSLPLPLSSPPSPSLHFTIAICCRQSALCVVIKMRSVLNLVVSISLSHAAARFKV